MALGILGLFLLCTRFRTARQLARGHEPRADRLRRTVAARQRFDPAAGAALPALGSGARRRRTALSCSAARSRRTVSMARGAVALNEAAERITAPPSWRAAIRTRASSFPAAPVRCVFDDADRGAVSRCSELEALGVAHDRITAEEQSRNTIENAVFSRLVAQPKPGERWLLVTSAFHMPRAIAAFRAAGFRRRSLSGRLAHPRADRCGAAVCRSARAWRRPTPRCTNGSVSLVYRLTGRTKELFPAP